MIKFKKNDWRLNLVLYFNFEFDSFNVQYKDEFLRIVIKFI